MQLAVIVQPQEQRAKSFATSARLGVAADHALLHELQLDLHPVVTAPLLVERIAAFSDDALEVLPLRLFKESATFADDVFRIEHAIGFTDRAFQQRLALLQRKLAQIFP